MQHERASGIELAAAAYARGSALPRPHLPNLEQRQGARYVAELSCNLSDDEMVTLAGATNLRERALEKTREGDLEKARALFRQAKDYIDAQISRPEALASARSYYAAAVAFLELTALNPQAAYELMYEALVLCGRLHLEYGHSVEVRRVHLSRNIARVLWRLGRHEEAWSLCLGLLNYVWTRDAAWPLGEDSAIAVGQREVLRLDERIFLTDQALSEAISTAFDAGRAKAHLHPVLTPSPDWMEGAPADRIVGIGTLCVALGEADHDAVLRSLAHYFEQGQGALPMCWHRLQKLLQDLSETSESV